MTVPYRGRQVDPVALWGDYVEFPVNFTGESDNEFSPLVRCPNPDHDTNKRHFQVNLRKPLVHCFAGCGISGSYEHAIAMIEGVTHRQARKSILRHSRVGGPSRPRPRKRGSTPSISSIDLEYERILPHVALEYLERRGFSSSTIAHFELGWDPEEKRIVIPVKDARGRVRMLCRRGITEKQQPKYLYTEGVERNALIFGLDDIDLGMVRSVGLVTVEGAFDRMMMWQNGIKHTVAILGSKVSEIQGQLIANTRPKAVYTMFDADAAGVGATISARRQIPKAQIKVCRYPKGKTDPAVMTQEEAERAITRAIVFSKWFSSAVPKQRPRRKEISFG